MLEYLYIDLRIHLNHSVPSLTLWYCCLSDSSLFETVNWYEIEAFHRIVGTDTWLLQCTDNSTFFSRENRKSRRKVFMPRR